MRVVHWGTPVSGNWMETLPSAPVLTGLPIAVQVPPLRYCKVTETPSWAGSNIPEAVAVSPQSLPVQSRWMLKVGLADGTSVSTSVCSFALLRANTFAVPSTT